MNRPVDKTEFWVERLEAATDPRDAVFKTTEDQWNIIDTAHKSILTDHVKPWNTVLDAGCGMGRASVFIPGIYTGMDFCREFIQRAMIDYPDKYFESGDLRSLRFDSDYFDWVVCISIQEMVCRELGWGVWKQIQTELLRVSSHGVLCLEYGSEDSPSIYSWIRKS